MEARTSTAEERRAGDLDQDTREEEVEATEGEDTAEEEGTEGAGVLTRGSLEESLEDGGMTGEMPQRRNSNLQTGLD